MQSTEPVAFELPRETANDRLKRRAELLQSHALVIAVLLHFAVLGLWPAMTAADLSNESSEVQVIAPPVVDIPPAPDQLVRPAAPVISTAPIDENITIPSVGAEQWSLERLAPPRATSRESVREEYTRLMPSMVAPRVLNQEEVERALVRFYPPLLRDAGIGGIVEVMMWLDENGKIVKAEVSKTSGYPALDEAALNVIEVMRLAPAYNMSKPTRVIVQIPIKFTVR